MKSVQDYSNGCCRERCKLKKKTLHTILALIFPIPVLALGLGEIQVHSALGQPFHAEIELMDVGNLSLTSISANIASAQDFEQMGLERTYVLDYFTFSVTKNAQGKSIILIQSSERINEPFFEILLDLTTSKNQVERAYTIMLDPPNYQLVKVKHTAHVVNSGAGAFEQTPGVVEKNILTESEATTAPIVQNKPATTYGPTIDNDNIWQIAQRYKTDDVSLQQMILAILGTNPDAFTDGNLNGLKVGITLKIPPSTTVRTVDSQLSKKEVYQQDSAWQAKIAIQHILMPPYINTKNVPTNLGLKSALLPVPNAPVKDNVSMPYVSFIPKTNTLLTQGNELAPSPNSGNIQQVANMKAEVDLASTAIDSVRESNQLLKEQLALLQAQNKQLQEQLKQRDEDFKRLEASIHKLTQRQGLAGQGIQASTETGMGTLGRLLILLTLAGLGAGIIYWRYWLRMTSKPAEDTVRASSSSEPLIDDIKPLVGVEIIRPEEESINDIVQGSVLPELPPEEVAVEDNSIDFIVEQLTESKPKRTKSKPPSKSTLKEKKEKSLKAPKEKSQENLESFQKQDTLLDLARTYISMQDFKIAKQAITEVLYTGNTKQKQAAKRLLKKIPE